MADGYDAVVVGAGHNGLTCAAYLARAGRRVLVLERGPEIGGMTRSAELAGPGFLSDVHASGYLVARLSQTPADLGLRIPQVVPDPNWAQVFPDGRVLLIGRDVAATAASLAQFSERDAATWRTLFARYLAARPAIVAGMFSAPETLAAQLGVPGGAAGYRDTMQTARDWAEETFESPEARLFFTSAALHFGLGPDDPMGGTFAWLFVSAIQDVGCAIVTGGMGQVAAALASVVTAHGGTVRTGAEVAEIVVESGRATGVRLAGGERIAVDGPVAVNADPRHLMLELLGGAPEALAARMRRYAWGPSFFTIHLALDRPVAWAAGPAVGGVAYVHASELSVDTLAANFVDIRAGRAPARPMLGVINELGVDPSRAPAGKALLKIVVHFVPYALAGPGGRAAAHWDTAEAYADGLIDWLDAAFLPGLAARTLSRSVHSPLDLERGTSSAVEGTHMHGAFVPWQVGGFRPLPELAGYRGPVAGVYLCGAGAHPGSGVSMGPGRNAAAAICADLGLGFPGTAPGAAGA